MNTNKKNARSIFISNNGLTDHIGISQILPYLSGLSDRGYALDCITVERTERYSQYGDEIRTQLLEKSITAHPLFIKKSSLSKLASLYRLRAELARLARQYSSSRCFIHARSYMPLSAVLAASESYKLPFIFDMRGFWIDQRIEGGVWDENVVLWRKIIEYFRSLEARAIRNAAHLVVLTEDAKKVIEHHSAYAGSPVSVVPCSVDFNKFSYSSSSREKIRSENNLGDTMVIAYLGSTGSVYRTQIIYQIYDALRNRGIDCRLMFLGRTQVSEVVNQSRDLGIKIDEQHVLCKELAHHEVANYLSAADFGTCFLTTTFSSLGVSATKVGEYLATGLPVLTNTGIGDIRRLVKNGENGFVLDDFSRDSFDKLIGYLIEGIFAPREAIREKARMYFDMNAAIEIYDSIYYGVLK